MPAAHHRDALATPFDGQRGRSRRIACLTLQTLRLTASYPPFRLDSASRAARSYFRRSVRGSAISSRSLVSVEDVAYQIYGLRIPAFKRSPARFVFLPDEGMAFFQQCCVGRAPRDHVLLSESGKIWRRQHAGPFRLAAARAGLPSTFVFHGLRHTYAPATSFATACRWKSWRASLVTPIRERSRRPTAIWLSDTGRR
jgi:integrase